MADPSGGSTTSNTSPSNPYQANGNQGGSQALVTVGQQLTQAVNNLVQAVTLAPATINSSFINAFPPTTTASSPVPTGINNLSTASISVIGTSTTRHGIIFHNPATSNVNVYVYPSTIGTPPTLAAPGGAFLLLPAATLALPALEYANINVAFSAFASTGTNNALTILEFH